MKITISGKDYILDVDKAQCCGALKQTTPQARRGDVWSINGARVLICQAGYSPCGEEEKFFMSGLCGNAFEAFSFGTSVNSLSIEGLNEYLAESRAVFVKNIASEVSRLMKQN